LRAKGKKDWAIPLEQLCEDLGKTYDIEVQGWCVIKAS
jgi:hypothetical protein